MHPSNGVDQLVGTDRFRDVAAGAGSDRRDDVLGRIRHRQRQEAGARTLRQHGRDDVRSRPVWEVDVHEDDIGIRTRDALDRRRDVSSLSDQL